MHLRKIFLFLVLTLIFTLLTPSSYAAVPPCDPNDPNFAPCPAGLDAIENTFKQFVQISVGLGFVALLVLALMAGFKYLTSGGEPKAVQAAHQTLTWALLGIFFMAIAWLVLLLIETITGVKVTEFNIKTLCKGIPGC